MAICCFDIYTQPGGDNWYVSILYTEVQPYGALNPLYAQKVIDYYFALFEKHSHGQMGKAVNYFFQDELLFGGSMPYWSPGFAERFLRMKGYNILPDWRCYGALKFFFKI